MKEDELREHIKKSIQQVMREVDERFDETVNEKAAVAFLEIHDYNQKEVKTQLDEFSLYFLDDFLMYAFSRAEIRMQREKGASWLELLGQSINLTQESFPLRTPDGLLDIVELEMEKHLKDGAELKKWAKIPAFDEETLDGILTWARYLKFQRRIAERIYEGGKYADLLEIHPKDFDLPKQWEQNLSRKIIGTDQQSTIDYILREKYFNIDELKDENQLKELKELIEIPEEEWNKLILLYGRD